MIAILVLVIAMGCHKLATRRAFFRWQRDSLTSFLVPSLLLNLYLSSYGRYRVVGLSLSDVSSLLGCYALISMSHWGDGMSDASGKARHDYYGYLFLADALSALGFTVMLAACIASLLPYRCKPTVNSMVPPGS